MLTNVTYNLRKFLYPLKHCHQPQLKTSCLRFPSPSTKPLYGEQSTGWLSEPQVIELPLHILIRSMELLMVIANHKIAKITIPRPASMYFVLLLGDSLYTNCLRSFS